MPLAGVLERSCLLTFTVRCGLGIMKDHKTAKGSNVRVKVYKEELLIGLNSTYSHSASFKF